MFLAVLVAAAAGGAQSCAGSWAGDASPAVASTGRLTVYLARTARGVPYTEGQIGIRMRWRASARYDPAIRFIAETSPGSGCVELERDSVQARAASHPQGAYANAYTAGYHEQTGRDFDQGIVAHFQEHAPPSSIFDYGSANTVGAAGPSHDAGHSAFSESATGGASHGDAGTSSSGHGDTGGGSSSVSGAGGASGSGSSGSSSSPSDSGGL